MNQKKQTTKEDHGTREQQMRARIKTAAFKLMAEQGIDNVSMRAIAEKVHVTKPVLYYYFKDKEDLIWAIIDEKSRQFDEFLEGALAKGAGADELLEQLFRRHLDFFEEDPRNSKFIIKTIAYLLNNKVKNFEVHNKRRRVQEFFMRAAQKGGVPEKALPDLERLVRAVEMQITFNAYVKMHAYGLCSDEEDGFFTKEVMDRLAKIIVLGVRAYYQKDKK